MDSEVLIYTSENDEKIELKFHKEKCLSSSFVQVAKAVIIPKNTIANVKGRVNGGENPPFCLSGDNEKLSMPEIFVKEMENKTINFTINNKSGGES